jgi:hypothetical protein
MFSGITMVRGIPAIGADEGEADSGVAARAFNRFLPWLPQFAFFRSSRDHFGGDPVFDRHPGIEHFQFDINGIARHVFEMDDGGMPDRIDDVFVNHLLSPLRLTRYNLDTKRFTSKTIR